LNRYNSIIIKMGKVAVVTGASYGIGKEIAKQLAKKGYEVALLARGLPKLREVQFEIAKENGVSLALQCDVSDKESVREAVLKVKEAYGNIDVLINNAAYVPPLHKFVEGEHSEWEKAIAVNVWGNLNMTREILPGMLENKHGKIIFMGSKAGISPTAMLAVHSGTKHMLEGLVGAIRQEIAGSGVSLSIVRPGGVATPGYDHAVNSSDGSNPKPNWIPSKASSCLDPEVVAAQVVNIVDLMDTADITDINIAAVATP